MSGSHAGGPGAAGTSSSGKLEPGGHRILPRVAEDPVARAEKAADRDTRFLHGRDGWLFLDRDSNAVVEQHGGLRLLSDAQLTQWASALAARAALASAAGAGYLHLVPPNGHAVNEEFLPDEVPRGRPRPILQLLAHLAAAGDRGGPDPPRAGVDPQPVVYPLAALRAARARGWPYAKTDTHWTRLGAWIAYGQIAPLLRRSCDLRVLGDHEVTAHDFEWAGDLGRKLTPRAHGPATQVEPRRARHVVVADNLVRNNGRLIDVTCDAAPATRALVVGDSFSYHLLPFLSESFGALRFAHAPFLDPRLVDDWNPDVVLTILNERFLLRPPRDDDQTFAELVERKLRGGLVMTPKKAARYARNKFAGWPGPPIGSERAAPER